MSHDMAVRVELYRNGLQLRRQLVDQLIRCSTVGNEFSCRQLEHLVTDKQMVAIHHTSIISHLSHLISPHISCSSNNNISHLPLAIREIIGTIIILNQTTIRIIAPITVTTREDNHGDDCPSSTHSRMFENSIAWGRQSSCQYHQKVKFDVFVQYEGINVI